jgi:hypothetical protein
MKKANIKELIHYIFTLQNIRFFIYAIYVIYLIVYALKTLENGNTLNFELIDEAIMLSFLVFVAYDGLVDNYKKINFSSYEFLKKILYSIFQEKQEHEEKN